MSNLNEFKDPTLKLIKSRLYIAKGVNDSPTSVTLESTTRYIRVKHVDGGNKFQMTITLDGSTPNLANSSAFQINVHGLNLSNSGSASYINDSQAIIIFENKVAGGNTFICAYSNNASTWSDESSGAVNLLLEQYSY
jgi:hypothetical protein